MPDLNIHASDEVLDMISGLLKIPRTEAEQTLLTVVAAVQKTEQEETYAEMENNQMPR